MLEAVHCHLKLAKPYGAMTVSIPPYLFEYPKSMLWKATGLASPILCVALFLTMSSPILPNSLPHYVLHSVSHTHGPSLCRIYASPPVLQVVCPFWTPRSTQTSPFPKGLPWAWRPLLLPLYPSLPSLLCALFLYWILKLRQRYVTKWTLGQGISIMCYFQLKELEPENLD